MLESTPWGISVVLGLMKGIFSFLHGLIMRNLSLFPRIRQRMKERTKAVPSIRTIRSKLRIIVLGKRK